MRTRFFVAAALCCDLHVDARRRRRRRHSMRSGAGREEALPGTALGGIAISILTFFSGNRGMKFARKIRFA
jgi:hypothetical protein